MLALDSVEGREEAPASRPLDTVIAVGDDRSDDQSGFGAALTKNDLEPVIAERKSGERYACVSGLRVG